MHAMKAVIEEIAPGKKKIKFNKGGRFKKLSRPKVCGDNGFVETKWTDSGWQPRDFLSLVLNIVLYKFCFILSFDTSCLMSRDGKTINLLLKSDTDDLKIIAERLGYRLALSLGATDQGSLFPCDS